MQFQPTDDQLSKAQQQDDKFGLPRGTTARQITQESGWNPNAVSPKGAMGYAQVIPKTLSKLEQRLNMKLDPSNFDDSLVIHGEIMGENKRKFGNDADALRPTTRGGTHRSGTTRRRTGTSRRSSVTPPRHRVARQQVARRAACARSWPWLTANVPSSSRRRGRTPPPATPNSSPRLVAPVTTACWTASSKKALRKWRTRRSSRRNGTPSRMALSGT